MAKAPTAASAVLGSEAPKFAELRKRLLFLVSALIVYRIGTFVPVPGIDPVALERFFDQMGSGSILNMFNMFSGGALERLSIFALGIMPYISASIIMQMMSVVVPSLAALKKEGEAGRRKITQYTRMGTVGLALFQSIAAASALQNQGVTLYQGPQFVFIAATTLVTGTMFLMWLGEQVTERGIGNGISMIILASIISGLPAAIGGTLELVNNGSMHPLLALTLFMLVLGVTYFVVFVERGQRRITVNYAKRQQGRKLMQAQSSHLPFKLNMSGVIPPIFASSIILFPATIASWFGTQEGWGWLQTVASTLSPGQPIYIMFYATMIIFFCFFYTALVFNSRETADNLKRSGAFIPGIRPGRQTGEYIDLVLTRLTLWGALYVTAVCLLPEFMILQFNVPFYFGGTSLLIIVVVVMDFMSQMQAHMMSHQYEGLMKKANLRGYGRAGGVR
ncbi:MAG: preprotein translocase subunit SecY [Gammaproteobacteria bacterium]|nr:preprotein translocase subunit SecY [Gammaproteobacteria bacterium]